MWNKPNSSLSVHNRKIKYCGLNDKFSWKKKQKKQKKMIISDGIIEKSLKINLLYICGIL